MNSKYVKIDEIIEAVFRDQPFAENDFQWGDAATWIGDLLQLMKIPMAMQHKVCKLTIENYKAELPDDLFQIETFKEHHSDIMMKYSGDPYFQHTICDDSACLTCICPDEKYKFQVNNNYVFTAFEEGEVDIAYYAIPVDDKGFPLIPDEEAIKRAFQWEIAYKLAYREWINDRLTGDKFRYIEQQRNWYVGKAMNTPKVPDINKMEAIKNFTLRLIPKINVLDNRFRNIPEKRYNHNTNNFNQGTQF